MSSIPIWQEVEEKVIKHIAWLNQGRCYIDQFSSGIIPHPNANIALLVCGIDLMVSVSTQPMWYRAKVTMEVTMEKYCILVYN